MTIDSRYLAVFSLLLLFGLGYDQLAAAIERRKIEGYTWALVVVGTAVGVSAAGPLIGWFAVRVVLACLAFCGAPMIVGAIVRHEKKVRASLARWRKLFDWSTENKPDDEQQG